MRISIVLAVLLVSSVVTAEPLAPIARAARGRNSEPLGLRFDAKDCVIHAALNAAELTIPLRKVGWSMTKETDGSGDAVVTARCAKASACITGRDKIAQPRFSFRLAASARDARKLFRTLSSFATNCTPLAPAATAR